MKPCHYEQDVLLDLHKQLPFARQLAVRWHCLTCPSCRERREEFRRTSRLLMLLAPSSASAAPLAMIRPRTRARLVLCSATIAIVSAALSYYYAFVASEPRAEPARETPAAAVNLGDCEMGGAMPPEGKRAAMMRQKQEQKAKHDLSLKLGREK